MIVVQHVAPGSAPAVPPLNSITFTPNPPVPVDVVNHPPHYNTGTIEVIEYIMDKFKDDYLLGNVCKYISRAKHKGSELQDLEKAQWYLTAAINECKARRSTAAS